MEQTYLQTEFFRLWNESDTHVNGYERRTSYDALAKRYREPQRAYHTLMHIEHCLREFDEVRHLAIDSLAIEFTLWFHDAIYEPATGHDDELLSAELARSSLKAMGLGIVFADKVHNYVLATKHKPGRYFSDVELLLDIDLAILGQPQERFDRYEDEIRFEYSFVPADKFRTGRLAVLQGFLDRKHIYYTQHFRDKYEKTARENLDRSIRRLSS